MSIDAPTEADDYSTLTDWLELTALFSTNGIAKVDDVVSAFEMSADTCEENFGEADTQIEDHGAHLADEIARRENALTDKAYPFIMSENGELLKLRGDLNYGHKTYLASLIHECSRNSGKLSGPHKMSTQEALEGRNKFEIFAVFATHGFCNGGHTFYIGRNRNSQANLLAYLNEACLLVGEGTVKEQIALPPFASKKPNDGGVDVIGVREERDGPPAIWYFGQSAAGADYKSKSATTEILGFCNLWFATPPANVKGLMLIAHILDSNLAQLQTPRLGHILHRLRLPLHAQNGMELYQNDNTKVHYVDDPDAPCMWLENYLKRVRAL